MKVGGRKSEQMGRHDAQSDEQREYDDQRSQFGIVKVVMPAPYILATKQQPLNQIEKIPGRAEPGDDDNDNSTGPRE